MTTNQNSENDNEESLYDGPSKSQLKRDSQHMIDVGEEILKLSREDRDSLNMSDELEER